MYKNYVNINYYGRCSLDGRITQITDVICGGARSTQPYFFEVSTALTHFCEQEEERFKI